MKLIWRQKTRIMGPPDGEEIMTLAFFVLTQYRRMTDRHTDGQTDTLRSVLPIASRGQKRYSFSETVTFEL